MLLFEAVLLERESKFTLAGFGTKCFLDLSRMTEWLVGKENVSGLTILFSSSATPDCQLVLEHTCFSERNCSRVYSMHAAFPLLDKVSRVYQSERLQFVNRHSVSHWKRSVLTESIPFNQPTLPSPHLISMVHLYTSYRQQLTILVHFWNDNVISCVVVGWKCNFFDSHSRNLYFCFVYVSKWCFIYWFVCFFMLSKHPVCALQYNRFFMSRTFFRVHDIYTTSLLFFSVDLCIGKI